MKKNGDCAAAIALRLSAYLSSILVCISKKPVFLHPSNMIGMDIPDNVFSSSYEVYSTDVDRFRRIKPSMLFSFMVETAWKQVKTYGIGHETEASAHIWVLSSLELEIFHNIAWQDIITIKTWPRPPAGLFFLRDFAIFLPDGTLAAAATSSWLFINRATRLPDRNAMKQVSLPYCHQSILGHDPKRLSENTGYEAMARVYPRFSDFDFHAHVNNSVYVGWIFDSCTSGFHEQHRPLRIQLDFIHELTSDGEISIGMLRQGLTDHFEGKISETGTLCFRGMVEWL
ncbi:MAG: hypothetical protein KA793_04195 [Bacteroidales bacterium]|nr:hypothetical protein [Bacteroidales bacterium]